MSSTVITIAITVLVVAFLLFRNVTWRRVKLAKLTRLPLVLAAFGALILVQTVQSFGSTWRPAEIDLSLLGSEFALAVGVGWVMGRLSEFRSVDGAVQSRLRAPGVVVFLGFIALRIVAASVDGHLGGTAALLSASVLLVIAVIKLTQGLVIRQALVIRQTLVGPTAGQVPVPTAEPQPALR